MKKYKMNQLRSRLILIKSYSQHALMGNFFWGGGGWGRAAGQNIIFIVQVDFVYRSRGLRR